MWLAEAAVASKYIKWWEGGGNRNNAFGQKELKQYRYYNPKKLN